MKITYEFVNGEKVEIEVGKRWEEVMIGLNIKERRNNHTETRRHYKLDASKESSECLVDSEESVEDLVIGNAVAESMTNKMKECLTEKQFDAFWKVCVEDYTEREYADVSGMSHQAVNKLVQAAKKKLRNIF